jgi:hypothetical protein
LELRVHGIGSHAPHEVLGAPERKTGDENIGVYALPQQLRPGVHAFVWSRTTRRWLGTYRYFLLPFTLVNVAGFMRREGSAHGDWARLIYSTLVALVGASVTVSYLFWLWAFIVDLPSVHGARVDVLALLFWIPILVIGIPVVSRIFFVRTYSGAPRQAVSSEQFWRSNGDRTAFVVHLALVSLIAAGLNAATGWEDDPLFVLAAAQTTLLVVLGGLVYRTALKQPQHPEIAGIFNLTIAVALPHIFFGALMVVASTVVEAFHAIRPGEVMLIALRPREQYWRFTFVMFSAALGLWGLDYYKRVIRPQPTDDEIRQSAAAYNESAPWVARVAWWRSKRLIRGFPGSLMTNGGSVLIQASLLGGLFWLGAIAEDTNAATAFSRALLGSNWNLLSNVLVLAIGGLTVALSIHRDWREAIAITYDVFGYWPRRYHPLAPTSYAGVTTARLTDALKGCVNTDEQCIVISHSQGSVLAYTSLLRTPSDVRGRVHLVTCGSPLATLYATCFPAYFSADAFNALRTQLRSWTNIHRDTDPIANHLFSASSDDLAILEPEPRTHLHRHSDYWTDPRMLEVLDGISNDDRGSPLDVRRGQPAAWDARDARPPTARED